MSQKSERLLKIYSRLKRGPVTIELIKQWAQKNNITISERTFYRDLNDLENSLMIENERLVVKIGEKNKKIWKIEYEASNSDLDEFDINSYLLFKNFMTLPVVSCRKKSLDKIENLFYKTYSKSRFEDFSLFPEPQICGSHFYEISSEDIYKKILDDCIWSIQNKRELEILELQFDYTSLGKNVVFPTLIFPVQLLYHRGVVHLCGFLKENQKFLIIALEQIKNYNLTNKMFDNRQFLEDLSNQMKRRFGVTENVNDKVYDIEIEFSELTGTYVKNQFWHSTQKCEILENGNLILKINCGINRELVGWIFQWMSNAKVLKPEILKNLVIEKYSEVLDAYKTSQPLISNNTFRYK